MADILVEGGQFLTDHEVDTITHGDGYIAEQLLAAQTYHAQLRAKGGAAILASRIGLSPAGGAEFVEKMDVRFQGLSKEAAEEILDQLNGLLAKIPELPESQPSGSLPAPAVPVAEIVSAAVVELQKDEEDSTEDQAEIDQQTEGVSGPVGEEQARENEELNESARKYLEDILGHIDDWSYIGTKDAQKLSDFLVSARGSMRRFSNGFDFGEAFLYKFQNMSDGDIAEKLEKTKAAVQSSLGNFKRILLDKHTTLDLNKAFLEMFGTSGTFTEETPDLPEQQVQAISRDPHVGESTQEKPAKNTTGPVPRPPLKPMPRIVQPASPQSSAELKSVNVANVLAGALKITDSRILEKLKAFLSLDIQSADRIKQVEKNKIAYAITDKLRRKYGNIQDVMNELRLNEAERVAFANVLGWSRRTDGQEQHSQPTLTALYIRTEGNQINQDREEAVRSMQKKIAEALVEQATPSKK